MIRTAVFPRRYVQGRGALAQFGAEAAKLGSRVYGLCDSFALDQVWFEVERPIDEENRAGFRLDTVYGKMPHMFAEHPRETIKRALYVAPYWEDPLQPLIETIGLDHILFNSDWPHPEGLADPNEYALYAENEVGVSREDAAKIMGGNLGRLVTT